METPLGSYEKEYLKMAILKHEETFKEQVYELHRLYRIQKILMKSIGSSSVHAFAGNNNNNSNENSNISCMDNKTVAILNYMKLQQQKQQEMIIRPAEEFVQVSAKGAINEEEESQVELTLGIGTTYNYDTKTKNRNSTSASSFSTSSSESTRSFDKFGSDDHVEAGGERQMKQQYPPWILQVLRLNST